MLVILLLLAALLPCATSEPTGNDFNLGQLREEIINIVKQALDNSTDDLEARIVILENDVEGLEENFDVLQEELIEVQAELGDVGDQINDINAQVSQLEAKVTNHTDEIAQLEIMNSELEERLNSLEEQVNALWIACESSPCANGATCVDINVDTFMCVCRDGYFGLTCSESYGDTTFLATIVDDIISPVANPITFNETRINPGGYYDNNTGIYTVPVDGTYEFYIQILSYPDEMFNFNLYVDGFEVTITRGSDFGSSDGHVSGVSQVLVHLYAGQEVWVQHQYLDAIYGTQGDGTMDSWFSGHLISVD